MANVLLGVTGSVAALKTPELYGLLRQAGFSVKVVASRAACYFFDPAAVDPVPGQAGRNRDVVILDEDEWPGDRYRRGDPVLHIELRRWADLLLIAPLDANTLGKLALGLCDSCLSCVWRAWEPWRPVVLAPAMNTLMWRHPATVRHLRQLGADSGLEDLPRGLDELVAAVNGRAGGLWVVPPVEKRLACEDVGVGGLAELPDILAFVRRGLAAAEAGRGEA